jgi:hypothetical protein
MTQSKWSERVLAQWESVTVTEYIDDIQRLYKKWTVICIALVAGGAAMIATASNPRLVAFGLFLSIAGIVNIAVTKLWVHTKMSMLRIVYELQKKHQAHTE